MSKLETKINFVNYAVLVKYHNKWVLEVGWSANFSRRFWKEHYPQNRGEIQFLGWRNDDSKRSQEKQFHKVFKSINLKNKYKDIARNELFEKTDEAMDFIRMNYNPISPWESQDKKNNECEACSKSYLQKGWSKRPWQQRAFKQLNNEKNWTINANTAAGKSLALKWLVLEKLEKDPTLHVIIAAPYTIIANNLAKDDYLQDENANVMHWKVKQKSGNLPTTKYFQDFMSNPKFTHGHDRLMVTTHMGLTHIKDLSVFKNCLLIIDEAHHVDTTNENSLGKIVNYFLDNKKDNLQLGIVTATPFRTNRADIVPKEYKEDFTNFFYAWDEYFKDTEYIKDFNYNFVLSEGTYLPSFVELMKTYDQSRDKLIIFIPDGNASLGTKKDDLDAIFESIAGKKINTRNYRELANGLIEIKRGDKWIKVIDLVTDSSVREIRKDYILANANNKDKIDVIIALKMFKEGADWSWANKEIILGKRGSVVDVIQTMGRVMRDTPNKKNMPPSIFHIVPFAHDNQEDESIRRSDMNDYLNAVYLSMLFYDARKPESNRAQKIIEACGGDVNKATEFQRKAGEAFAQNTGLDSDIENNKEEQVKQAKDLGTDFDIDDKNLLDDLLNDAFDINMEQSKRKVSKKKSFKLAFDYMDVSDVDAEHVKNVNLLDWMRHDIASNGRNSLEILRKFQFEEGGPEKWSRNHDACIDYFNNNGKYPNQHDGYIGGWLNNVRAKQNIRCFNFLNDFVENDPIHKNMYQAQQEEMESKVLNLINFIISENRYPNRSSENDIEKKLGIFHTALIKSKNKKTSNFPNEYQIMAENANLKNLFDYRRNSNIEYYLSIAKLIEKSNKVPREGDLPIDFNGKKLNIYNWVVNQRQKTKSNNKNSFSFLLADEHFNENGWEGFLRPQSGKDIKRTSWQPGMGRGFSFDIGWEPCMPEEEWQAKVNKMTKQEGKVVD